MEWMVPINKLDAVQMHGIDDILDNQHTGLPPLWLTR